MMRGDDDDGDDDDGGDYNDDDNICLTLTCTADKCLDSLYSA